MCQDWLGLFLCVTQKQPRQTDIKPFVFIDDYVEEEGLVAREAMKAIKAVVTEWEAKQ